MANCTILSKGPTALRKWLDKNNMSVRDLALRIDRSPDLIHAWMNNRSRPVVGDLIVIDMLTNVCPNEWLTPEERKRLTAFKRREKKVGGS